MEAKERLIVALDVDTKEEAFRLIDALSPEVDVFKVGIAPFTDFGESLIDKLQQKGKKIFLDLKFHDIPNTVANATKAAARKNVFMLNFHCLGGKKMMEAAKKAAESSEKAPMLLGVTILTSTDEEEMKEIGLSGAVQEKVLHLAEMCKAAGFDGVVASAKEAKNIKEKLGKDFKVVTPGIRPEWAAAGDQKRVLTPSRALSEGADYIVVGRPIIHADNPLRAAQRIIEEMENSV